MGETNGSPKEPQDRLARLEASHVRLMTDFEVSWARHEKFVEEHEKFVAKQDREWARQQERWKKQKERDKVLDKRIDKLVSGIGELIRQQQEK